MRYSWKNARNNLRHLTYGDMLDMWFRMVGLVAFANAFQHDASEMFWDTVFLTIFMILFTLAIRFWLERKP